MAATQINFTDISGWYQKIQFKTNNTTASEIVISNIANMANVKLKDTSVPTTLTLSGTAITVKNSRNNTANVILNALNTVTFAGLNYGVNNYKTYTVSASGYLTTGTNPKYNFGPSAGIVIYTNPNILTGSMITNFEGRYMSLSITISGQVIGYRPTFKYKLGTNTVKTLYTDTGVSGSTSGTYVISGITTASGYDSNFSTITTYNDTNLFIYGYANEDVSATTIIKPTNGAKAIALSNASIIRDCSNNNTSNTLKFIYSRPSLVDITGISGYKYRLTSTVPNYNYDYSTYFDISRSLPTSGIDASFSITTFNDACFNCFDTSDNFQTILELYTYAITSGVLVSGELATYSIRNRQYRPPDVPGVNIVSVVDSSVNLKITVPNNRGKKVSKFQYTLAGTTTDITDYSSSYYKDFSFNKVIQNLNPSTVYNIPLSAVNAAGNSNTSNIIFNTLPPDPSFTLVLIPTVHNRPSININFTIPNSYSISYSKYQCDVSWGGSIQKNLDITNVSTINTYALTSSITIINKTIYDVSLILIDLSGRISKSITKKITASTVPDNISSPIVTITYNSITFTYSTPDDGGSPITGYLYTLYTDTNDSNPSTNNIQPTTSHQISNLNPSTRYGIDWRTLNINGQSSGYFVNTRYYTKPEDPSFTLIGVQTVNFNSQVQIQITINPLTLTHQYSYVNYSLTCMSGSTLINSGIISYSTSEQIYNIQNIQRHNTYTISLTLKDTSDALSRPVVKSIYTNIPYAISPTNVNITSTSIELQYVTPDDGGSPITNYYYQYYGYEFNTITSGTVPSTNTSYSFTSLTPSTKYDISYATINAAGYGIYFSSYNTKPYTPSFTISNIQPTSFTVTVNAAPLGSIGYASYNYTCIKHTTSEYITGNTISYGNTFSFSITSLRGGTTYDFSMILYNINNDYSDISSTNIITLPNNPIIDTSGIQRYSDYILVPFYPPSYNGDVPITAYRYKIGDNPYVTFSNFCYSVPNKAYNISSVYPIFKVLGTSIYYINTQNTLVRCTYDEQLNPLYNFTYDTISNITSFFIIDNSNIVYGTNTNLYIYNNGTISTIATHTTGSIIFIECVNTSSIYVYVRKYIDNSVDKYDIIYYNVISNQINTYTYSTIINGLAISNDATRIYVLTNNRVYIYVNGVSSYLSAPETITMNNIAVDTTSNILYASININTVSGVTNYALYSTYNIDTSTHSSFIVMNDANKSTFINGIQYTKEMSTSKYLNMCIDSNTIYMLDYNSGIYNKIHRICTTQLNNPCPVYMLNPGIKIYTIAISCNNVSGWSSDTNSVSVNFAVLSEPINIQVENTASRRLRITWATPINDGGYSQYLYYQIQIKRLDNSIITTYYTSQNIYSYTTDVLTVYDTNVNIYVCAKTELITGPDGNTIAYVASAPNPPTINNCLITINGNIQINYSAPIYTGNDIIRKYQYSLDNGNTYYDISNNSGLITTDGSFDIINTNVIGGAAYLLKLRAYNQYLSSNTTTYSSYVYPYYRPQSPIVNVFGAYNYVDVSYINLNNGGYPINKYKYGLTPNSETYSYDVSYARNFDVSFLQYMTDITDSSSYIWSATGIHNFQYINNKIYTVLYNDTQSYSKLIQCNPIYELLDLPQNTNNFKFTRDNTKVAFIKGITLNTEIYDTDKNWFYLTYYNGYIYGSSLSSTLIYKINVLSGIGFNESQYLTLTEPIQSKYKISSYYGYMFIHSGIAIYVHEINGSSNRLTLTDSYANYLQNINCIDVSDDGKTLYIATQSTNTTITIYKTTIQNINNLNYTCNLLETITTGTQLSSASITVRNLENIIHIYSQNYSTIYTKIITNGVSSYIQVDNLISFIEPTNRYTYKIKDAYFIENPDNSTTCYISYVSEHSTISSTYNFDSRVCSVTYSNSMFSALERYFDYVSYVGYGGNITYVPPINSIYVAVNSMTITKYGINNSDYQLSVYDVNGITFTNRINIRNSKTYICIDITDSVIATNYVTIENTFGFSYSRKISGGTYSTILNDINSSYKYNTIAISPNGEYVSLSWVNTDQNANMIDTYKWDGTTYVYVASTNAGFEYTTTIQYGTEYTSISTPISSLRYNDTGSILFVAYNTNSRKDYHNFGIQSPLYSYCIVQNGIPTQGILYRPDTPYYYDVPAIDVDASNNIYFLCQPPAAIGRPTIQKTKLDLLNSGALPPILDLSNSSYRVNLVAYNTQDLSSNPTTSIIAYPYTDPTKPTINQLTRGYNSIDVSYSAPANDGRRVNDPLSSGIVSYWYSTGGTNYTQMMYSDSTPITTAGTYTINGLTAGTNYTVQLKAINSYDISNVSTSDLTAMPYTLPSPPTVINVSNVIRNRQLKVDFSANTYSGYIFDTSYGYYLLGPSSDTNYIYIDNSFNPTGIKETIGGTFYITHNGTNIILQPSSTYTVYLKSANPAGISDANISTTVTTFSVPPSPTVNSITGRYNCIDLSFTAATSNGDPISGYKFSVDNGIYYDMAGTFTDGNTYNYTITNNEAGTLLSSDTSYTVYLVASNSMGISSPGLSPTVSISTPPGPPTIHSVTPGYNEIIVNYSLPTNTGGAVLYKLYYDISNVYNVHYDVLEDLSSSIFGTEQLDGSYEYVIPQTANGIAYYVYMAVSNYKGDTEGMGYTDTLDSSAIPYTLPQAPVISSGSVISYADSISFNISQPSPAEKGYASVIKYKYSIDGTTYTDNGTSTNISINGLLYSKLYVIYVKAYNDAGDSNATYFQEITKPNAPTISIVATGDREVNISYSSITNGKPIVGYNYRYSFNSSGYTPYSSLISNTNGVSDGDISLNTVNGIQVGNYVFQITASNDKWESAATTTSSINTYTVPQPPELTSVTPGNRKINFVLTIPTDTGNTPLQKIQYKYTSTSNSIEYTDLMNDSLLITTDGSYNITVPSKGTYTLSIRTVNDKGLTSVDAIDTNIQVYEPATAPQNIVAIPRNKQIRVTYSEPESNGNSAITSYRYSINGTDYNPIPTPFTIPSLQEGTTYTVYMKAITASDTLDGDVGTSNPALVYTTPQPPTILTCVGQLNQISLTYDAPLYDGSNAITQYLYSLSSTGEYIDIGTTYSHIIALANDQNLQVKQTNTVYLKAYNEAGYSNVSSSTAIPNPFTLPSPPTLDINNITITNTQITFGNVSLSDDGGNTVSHYSYVLNSETEVTINKSSTITIDVSSSKQYTVHFYSINDAGYKSDTSTDYTFTTRPDAPTDFTVTPGNKTATFVFTSPITNGDSIVGYNYAYTYSTNAKTSFYVLPANNTLSLNDGSYTFYLTASNSAWTSTEVIAPNVQVYTNPSPLNLTSAVGNDRKITITFTVIYDGNRPITGYYYSIVNSESSSPGIYTPLTNGGIAVTDDGTYDITVSDSGNYKIYLKAQNSEEEYSLDSTVDNIRVYKPATAPTITQITGGNMRIDISFNAPDNNGNSSITEYKYQLNDTTLSTDSSYNQLSYTGTGPYSASITTGLSYGHYYNVSLTAVNEADIGGINTTASSVLVYARPQTAPTITSFEGSFQSATFTYNAPSNDGSSNITGYKYSLNRSSYVAVGLQDDNNYTITYVSDNNLHINQSNTLRLIATNAAGDSNESPEYIISTVPYTYPAPPSVSNISQTTTSVTFTINDTSDGGRPIDKYIYDISDSYSTTQYKVSASGQHTVSSLRSSNQYTIKIRSHNIAGDSQTQNTYTFITYPKIPIIDASTNEPNDPGAIKVSYSNNDTGNLQVTFYYSLESKTGPYNTLSSKITGTPGNVYTLFIKTNNGTYDSAVNWIPNLYVYGTPTYPTINSLTAGYNNVTFTYTEPTYPTSTGYRPVLNYKYAITAGGNSPSYSDIVPSDSTITSYNNTYTNGTYVFYEITQSRSFSLSSNKSCFIMVVGGGGGGGGSTGSISGGGGGGGGVAYGYANLTSNVTYNVTIGEGGNTANDGSDTVLSGTGINVIGYGGKGSTNGNGGDSGNATGLAWVYGNNNGGTSTLYSGGSGAGAFKYGYSLSADLLNIPGGMGYLALNNKSYGAGGYSGNVIGNNTNDLDAMPNTGNGGKGATVSQSTGGKGGSGIVIIGIPVTTYTVSATAGTPVTLWMKSTTVAGYSPDTSYGEYVLPYTTPQPIQSINVSALVYDLSVNFRANAFSGYTNNTNYYYSLYSVSGSTQTALLTDININNTFNNQITDSNKIIDGSFHITNDNYPNTIVPKGQYKVYMKTQNIAGYSSLYESSIVQEYDMPPTPTITDASCQNNNIRFTFTAGTPDDSVPNLPIQKYQYSVNGGTYDPNEYYDITNGVFTYNIGLQYGKYYNINVRAVNEMGNSTSYTYSSILVYTTPNPPTYSITASYNSIDVIYSYPTNDGSDNVFQYKYQLYEENNTYGNVNYIDNNTVGGSFTTNISITANGNSYGIIMGATNRAGYSDQGIVSTFVTPYTLPDPPTITRKVPNTSSVTFTMSSPLFTGYTTLTAYSYKLTSSDTYTDFDISNSKTISGLLSSKQYDIQIYAKNAAGYSSTYSTESFITGPEAPTFTSAIPSSPNTIQITFSAPASNNVDIVKIQYAINYNSDASYNDIPKLSGTYDITGIAAGNNYTVYLRAYNGTAYSSPASISKISVFTNPDAPTINTIAGSSQITFTYSAPTNTGNRTLVDYSYNTSVNSTYYSLPIDSTSQTISATPGTSIYVNLWVKNSENVYSSVADSSSVIPYTIPDAPNHVTVTPQIQNYTSPDSFGTVYLTVSFEANSTSGVTPNTNYKYKINDSADISLSTTVIGPFNITSDITLGTSYTIYMKATNIAGDSLYSISSTAVSYNVPSSPILAENAVGGYNRIAFKFFSPTNNGGLSVLGYKYDLYNMNTNTFSSKSDCIDDSLNIISIANPQIGVPYKVHVYAYNQAGYSSPLVYEQVYAYTLPNNPVVNTTDSSDTSVFITYNAPTYDGCSNIISYAYKFNPSDSFIDIADSASLRQYRIENLNPSTHYDASFAAKNAAGYSSPTSTVTFTTYPEPPIDIVTASGYNQISFTYSANPNNIASGSGTLVPVTKYAYVLYNDTQTSSLTDLANTHGSYTISKTDQPAIITPGNQFKVRLYSYNSKGYSLTYTESSPIYSYTLPNAPLFDLSSSTATTISFRHRESTYDGSSAITEYQYTITQGMSTIIPYTISSPGITYTIDVSSSLLYIVRIRSKNAAEYSTNTLCSIITYPGTPNITNIEPRSSSIYFEYNMPVANEGNYEIRCFAYSIDDGNTYVEMKNSGGAYITSNTGSFTLPETLTPGQTYNLKLVKKLKNGFISPVPYTDNTGIVPYTFPTPPAISLTSTTSSVTIGITPPTSNSQYDGWNTITKYSYAINDGSYTDIDVTISYEITGLESNTIYKISVKSYNSAGYSRTSESAIINTIPSLPAIDNIVAGYNSITVYYTKPSGNATITDYSYKLTSSVSDSGSISTGRTTDGSYTINIGLTPGMSYTVSLNASNSNGTSEWVASSQQAVPYTVPNAPSFSHITAGISQLTLSYSMNTAITGYDGYNTIKSYWYDISYTGYPATLIEIPNNNTIEGLTPGIEYTIRIYALNDADYSSPSRELQGIPYTYPNAPIIEANAGINCITYNYAALSLGDDGYSSIISRTYTLTDSTTSSSSIGTVNDSNKVINAIAGHVYELTMTAKNAAGDSGISNTITNIMPYEYPHAPAFDLIPKNTSIDISYGISTYDGYRPITMYKYDISINNVATEIIDMYSNGNRVYNVGNLKTSQLYYISTYSFNLAGLSTDRTVKTTVTLPNAPIINSAIGLANKIHINVSSANTGTFPISKYKYNIYDAAAQHVYTGEISGDTINSDISISYATDYTVELQSYNGNYSLTAVYGSILRVYTIPNPPSIISLIGHDDRITVTFSDPTYDGLNAITERYFYISNMEIISDSTSIPPSQYILMNSSYITHNANGTFTYTIENKDGVIIQQNMYYSVICAVKNQAGMSGRSNTVSIVALEGNTDYINSTDNGNTNNINTPDNFTIQSQKVYNSSILLNINLPTNTKFDGFEYEVLDENNNIVIHNTEYSSSTTPLLIRTDTLFPNVLYHVKIRAYNSYGDSGYVNSNGFYILMPPVITIDNMHGFNNYVTADFTITDNGYTITNIKYNIKYSYNPSETYSLPSTSARTLKIDVSNTNSVTLTMVATNSAGDSNPSTRILAARTIPGPPSFVSIYGGLDSIIFRYNAPSPSDTGNSDIIDYKYNISDDNGNTFLLPDYVSLNTNTPGTYTIHNGDNGIILYQNQNYKVTLVAVNSIGDSTRVISSAVKPVALPDPPVIESITYIDNKVYIYFTPGDNHDSTVTGYKYSYDGINYIYVEGMTSPFVVDGIYNMDNLITLKASTTLGDSEPSNTKTIHIPDSIKSIYRPAMFSSEKTEILNNLGVLSDLTNINIDNNTFTSSDDVTSMSRIINTMNNNTSTLSAQGTLGSEPVAYINQPNRNYPNRATQMINRFLNKYPTKK